MGTLKVQPIASASKSKAGGANGSWGPNALTRAVSNLVVSSCLALTRSMAASTRSTCLWHRNGE